MTSRRLFGRTLLLLPLLAGCEPIVSSRDPMRSGYAIGQTLSARVGMPVLDHRTGELESLWVWKGILGGGWSSEKRPSSVSRRELLIYAGISDEVVHFEWTEYRDGRVEPVATSSLIHDLAVSRVIAVRNFTLQVLEADNLRIVVKILSDDPAYVAQSPSAPTATTEVKPKPPTSANASPRRPRPVRPAETETGLPTGTVILGPR